MIVSATFGALMFLYGLVQFNAVLRLRGFGRQATIVGIFLSGCLAVTSAAGFFVAAGLGDSHASSIATDLAFVLIVLAFLVRSRSRPTRARKRLVTSRDPREEVGPRSDGEIVLNQGPPFAIWPSLLIRALTLGKSKRMGFRPRLVLRDDSLVVESGAGESQEISPLSLSSARLLNARLFSRVLIDIEDPPERVIFEPVRHSEGSRFVTELMKRRR